MDRLLGSYRPSKKWWWNLSSNGLNMAVVAGWLLHCELYKGSDAAMTHIDFRRDVTMSLLQLKPKHTRTCDKHKSPMANAEPSHPSARMVGHRSPNCHCTSPSMPQPQMSSLSATVFY
ncbi:hypothetical protein MRX96_022241 [Rhipicephalus microplus]